MSSSSRSVSIPVGFFQALQHHENRDRWKEQGRFQSLSGFFRPCNLHFSRSRSASRAAFQSLSGFFRPCNVKSGRGSRVVSCVSIPVGFFQALQRGSLAPFDLVQPVGFNPCRVFSGLATAAALSVSNIAPSFQSLSGFFRPCNNLPKKLMGCQDRCFNPCRVFSGLATVLSKSQDPPDLKFQSLSGFFRPCNSSPVIDAVIGGNVSIPVGFFQALQLFDPPRPPP